MIGAEIHSLGTPKLSNPKNKIPKILTKDQKRRSKASRPRLELESKAPQAPRISATLPGHALMMCTCFLDIKLADGAK